MASKRKRGRMLLGIPLSGGMRKARGKATTKDSALHSLINAGGRSKQILRGFFHAEKKKGWL